MALVEGKMLSSGDVVERVYSGGFGEVAILRHDAFGYRAIKRIKDDVLVLHREDATRQFLAEAARWFQLAGAPYVAKASFAWPNLDDLGPVLFLERIKGPTTAMLLHALRDAGHKHLTPSEAFRIGWQTSEALAYAHQQKICHRDIKPSNIMLTATNEVRIIDWGIAGALGEIGVEAFAERYSSERKLANPGLCDPADDLYSLGIVLFEFLTSADHKVKGLSRAQLKTTLETSQPSLSDEAVRIVLELLDENSEVNASNVASRMKTLLPDLLKREADRPYCRDCGARFPGEIAPCPVCNGQTFRRKEVVTPASKDMVRISAGQFTSGITLDQAKTAFTAIGMEANQANLAAIGFDPAKLTSTTGRAFLPTFYIDRYPVTNEQFASFCAETGYPMPKDIQLTAGNHPVVNVTWRDAFAYAAYYGKRLPSSLEWDKAARGDADQRPYPWGAIWDQGRCNHRNDPIFPTTTPVDFFESEARDGRSPYGVADMAGNVSEFMRDGKVAGSKTVKGGGFADPVAVLGLIGTGQQAPESYSSPATGFRCACDVTYADERIEQ